MSYDSKHPFPPPSGKRASESVPARPEPGRGPELLAALETVAGLLCEVPVAVEQLDDEQRTSLVQVLLRLQARSGQAATVVTASAVRRGTVRDSGAANTFQWVTTQAGEAGVIVEPRDVKAIAVVADACQEHKNHVIADAVSSGACTLPVARVALTSADKVGPLLPTAARDGVLEWFLGLEVPGVRGVQAMTRHLLARYEPDRLSAEDAHLERVESLTFGQTATGMTRMVAELSPANAAVVKAAVMAGSAPQPATETTENGSPPRVLDDRTPGKRRADALMELVHAGARAGADTSGMTVGAVATLLVTMGMQTLTEGVGASTTPIGDVLDAGAARKAACDADLIPVVLGGPSQPLDVGRRERLVTKGLRAAVVVRDKGCTFPGCDRPPGFCEVHHVTPWWAGGETSLHNSAMLCCRHHQTVHRHGYTATVTADGVRWDLTAGRMPGHATAKH